MSTQAPTERDVVVLDSAALHSLPWHKLPGYTHVTYKLLWQSGKSVAGIMHVPAGAEMSSHVHRNADHHIWVLDGAAEMQGQQLTKGTYVHVPAGREHGLAAPGPAGCTVFYLYLRDTFAERSSHD